MIVRNRIWEEINISNSFISLKLTKVIDEVDILYY